VHTVRARSDTTSSSAQGVRVRFAPSPTGDLHLGSAMVAVANRAFASGHGGTLVLRVDDTDAVRSTEAATEGLLDVLAWLEVECDEGPVHQSSLERSVRHAAVVAQLVATGAAYPCFCDAARLAELAAAQRAAGQAPRYDGRCAQLTEAEVEERRARGERPATRLGVDPVRDWSFQDLVHGDVAAPAGSFGDLVVARSDGSATYMLASVVDDADLDITHVLRGSDHLANTPRQLAIFAAIGAEPPAFAHLPILLGDHGAKLAKRDATGSVVALRRDGVLPGAVRALCWELLGQASGADACDPFGVEGWQALDLAKVPRSSPQVARARLASLGTSVLAAWPLPALRAAVVAAIDGRLPDDVAAARDPARLDGLLDDMRGGLESPAAIAREIVATLAPDGAAPAGDGDVPPEVADLLAAADLDAQVGAERVMLDLRALAKERGWKLGQVLPVLRLALTGQRHGPRLGAVLHALGGDAVRARLAQALEARANG
jgi:glutamyl-tRNA synthetase